MESEKSTLVMRAPEINDARAIWRLVGESGVLDQNSAYLYLLLCRDFNETCLVAEVDARLVGFVTAYRLPSAPQVLFVWQVGVCKSVRRKGVALRLLTELLGHAGRNSLQYIEATVAPDNLASRRLFESLARRMNVPLTDIDDGGFVEDDFPPGDHAAEPRLRIGPFNN